jgi:enoyl-CoA hydratase/carnithine racemase
VEGNGVEGVEAEAVKMAEVILRGAPQAVSRSKAFLDKLGSASVEGHLDLALSYHMEARSSEEAAEGMAAFLEKRPPSWSKATV